MRIMPTTDEECATAGTAGLPYLAGKRLYKKTDPTSGYHIWQASVSTKTDPTPGYHIWQASVPTKTDSTYKPIERVPRRFNKLVVPKALQEALPFKSKPKQDQKASKRGRAKRAVVLEPDAVANLATKADDARCGSAGTRAAYRQGLRYAAEKLARAGAALYLDAAHGGWLGWPEEQARNSCPEAVGAGSYP